MESNKLIADFMGVRYTDDNVYINTLKEMKADGVYFEQGYMASELKYDSDWNWLMDVVDKIESLSYAVGRHFVLRTESAYVQFIVDRMNIEPFAKWGTCGGGENKKIAVYNACIEFITWYNKQNKQK